MPLVARPVKLRERVFRRLLVERVDAARVAYRIVGGVVDTVGVACAEGDLIIKRGAFHKNILH